LDKLAPERFWILMKQEMMGWQWQQLDHMQIIRISLQRDNRASTLSLNFYRPEWCSFWRPTSSVKALKAKLIKMRFSWFLGKKIFDVCSGELLSSWCQLQMIPAQRQEPLDLFVGIVGTVQEWLASDEMGAYPSTTKPLTYRYSCVHTYV